ncbi:MAG: YkgJ family cysteine cluster protein [Thermoplasmata archaeon]|nr:YkgJ family cysteine cluster protein [Thermoplasmata archaeon]
MSDTVEQFLTAQRKLRGQTEWPPGTKFECRGCGDCCKWNFIILSPGEELAAMLRERAKYPHGSWIVEEERIRLQMPGFFFKGTVPKNQLEFITRTGRSWGYWVLNARDKVALYNPTACIHLMEEDRCAIYEERPRACVAYFCGRHPVIV